MSNTTFKVGDIVTAKAGTNYGMPVPGRQCVVFAINPGDSYMAVTLRVAGLKSTHLVLVEDFELVQAFERVQSNDTPHALDFLIAEVNKCGEYIRELHTNFAGQFQSVRESSIPSGAVNKPYARVVINKHEKVQRLPQKFKLADSNYTVEIAEGTVRVGCSVYTLTSALFALAQLLENEFSTAMLSRSTSPSASATEQIRATITGVRTDAGSITWRDAKQLYAALKEYK